MQNDYELCLQPYNEGMELADQVTEDIVKSLRNQKTPLPPQDPSQILVINNGFGNPQPDIPTIWQYPLVPSTSALISSEMIPPPITQVSSATSEQLAALYNYSNNAIDIKTPKIAIVLDMANVILAVASEFPKERARYFPAKDTTIIPSSNGSPAVKLSDVFDLPDKISKYKSNDSICYIRELAWLTLPYLRLGTEYDLGCDMKDIGALFLKARQILISRGIDVGDIFTSTVGDLFPPDSKYALGQYAVRPFIGERLVFDFGNQSYAYYCINGKNIYVPIRSVVRSDTNYISKAALPYSKYYLIGVEKLKSTNVETIALTPNPEEVFLNQENPGIAVVSWVGGLDTINHVDWTPLKGRHIYYISNPATFSENYSECSKVFEAICELLGEECHIDICYRPLSADKEPVPVCTLPLATFASVQPPVPFASVQPPVNDYRVLQHII